MARSLFVRASTSAAADRLLREAAAYHERLLARLGEGNRRLELSLGHAGSDEDVLIDTALYYATSERQGQAELLVRR